MSESLHKDEDECESSGSPGATVGLPYGRANGAIEAVQLDENKTRKVKHRSGDGVQGLPQCLFICRISTP